MCHFVKSPFSSGKDGFQTGHASFALAPCWHADNSATEMQNFFTPAHIHLAINHFPIIGLAVACVSVLIGILFHSRGALAAGLVAVLVCVGMMPLIMQTGESARESFVDGTIDPGMDAAGNAAFKQHAHRASATAPVVYSVGILALVSLLALIKFPRQAAWIGWAVLLGSMISIGLSIWTAEAGGRIRHTEFRSFTESTPLPAPAPLATSTPGLSATPVPAASPSSSPTVTVPENSTAATPMESPSASPGATNGM